MTKQSSVRLDEDVEKFIESKLSENTTKTDIINVAVRKLKESMEKGIETTTEIRVPFSEDADVRVIELKEVLKQINKEMRGYWCVEWERFHPRQKCTMPSSISEFPCIENIAYDCPLGKKESTDICPLEQHKEWRELLSRHLDDSA